MMEFQSPPTSRTDAERARRVEFQQRCDFARDLIDAADFLKWQWMHTPVSPVPLEIKYHILDDDAMVARERFEAYSEFLEEHHLPEEGRTFKAYGHRHEATTQHFAELAFRNGTVKYAVVWIEKDAEVTEPVHHNLRIQGGNGFMKGTCDACPGWGVSVPQGIDGPGIIQDSFEAHTEVTHNG